MSRIITDVRGLTQEKNDVKKEDVPPSQPHNTTHILLLPITSEDVV
jgi:hypothetical protein